MIDWANKLMKPVTNHWTTYRRLWDGVLAGKSRREAFQPMARWIADNPPFPGRAFRDWITWMYKENRLVRGRLRLRGSRLDLGRVDQSLLVVTAGADHIAPPAGTEPLLGLVSSEDVTCIDRPGGHIGLMPGRRHASRSGRTLSSGSMAARRPRGEDEAMATAQTREQPRILAGEKLKDRVALVTGGTRGIGAAICRSLANQGAAVAAGFGRDRERAESFQRELEQHGIPSTIHQGNVGSWRIASAQSKR